MALTAHWNEGNTLTGNCENAAVITGKGEKPIEEKPVEEETKEETTPSSQQNYEKCLQECSENRKHNGHNEHGIEQSCDAQCKNK